jgi:hypothetical protein
VSTGFTQIGRLAIREIKDEVRFYYAMPDTMKGALLLGTIRATLLRRQDVSRFHALISIYRSAVADIIEAQTGHRPTFDDPATAPEHERGQEPWKGDA